jgi:hypothetical protein
MNKLPILEIDVDSCGTKIFRLDGVMHREDGPAYEHRNGFKEWWFNGKRHRTDGPAIISSDGEYKGWFLNGKVLSYTNWFNKLTPEQQYNYLWNLDE